MHVENLASLLSRATSTLSLPLGKSTHTLLLKSLHPIPSFLFTHLITFYSKLNLPSTSLSLLLSHPSPSVVSWTSVMTGFCNNGDHLGCLGLFVEMLRRGGNVRPNEFTLPLVFKAVRKLGWWGFGRGVQGLGFKMGVLMSDEFVSFAALDMCFKMGFQKDGYRLFDEMSKRNLVCWNSVISNLVQDGRFEDAINGFLEVLRTGVKPDSVSVCMVLNACVNSEYLSLGFQVHGFVIRFGLESNVLVGNTLVDFYGKFHEAENAYKMFDEMPVKNSVSWSSIISVLTQNGYEFKALNVYLKSQREGFGPSEYMISSVLTACIDISRFDLGRSIHSIAIKSSFHTNLHVSSALVNMYGRCGFISQAQQMFDEMPERNLVSFNAIIGAYSHHGDIKMVLSMFNLMLSNRNILPNYVTLVCVLTACSKVVLVKLGLGFFQIMKKKWGIEARVEHYACIVDLLGRAGQIEQAYEIIKRMNIEPCVSIWGALLGACKMHGNVELGKIAGEKLCEMDPRDLGNCVLVSNILASAGRWNEAIDARKVITETRSKKDPGYSWISYGNQIHDFEAKDKSHQVL